ncbi:MAG TPA: efflux RND transporter periplasmic adaptor subunit [Chitinophagales bacterium]|nr:MAG: efflux transporter periplasmic adaptor subunit [Bacteroidetes bacterium 37-13]HRN94800.1 efflux RND transporter periplasmic adaptor subunit [Chitinophagales bacterium]HRP38787.1 efflux RND transporter periplasmic adaptor subunit [Chitinophagales bacterium]
MKFYIKHILLSVLFYVGLLAMNSCGNHDAHNHSNEEAAHEHSETESSTTSLSKAQMQAVGVVLGKVENKELTSTIQANGVLKVPNNSRANISSIYGGIIQSINVEIGDNVKKGQVIATIANPQFVQLQEEYLAASSKLLFAEQEHQRQNDLNKGNAGALKNLQNATAELDMLRSKQSSLKQQIILMGINPTNISSSNLKPVISVTSPLSGTVSNLYAIIGAYVDATSPIAEIVDNASLHLDLHIFEKDLPLLKIGQVIHFTLTNNPVTEYDAKIYSIGSSFESESKTISVHCDVTGNKQGLIDGMNISAIVSLNNVTQPAVPNDAIVNANNKDYVFIVKNSEKTDSTNFNFERIEVVKGVSNMGYTAITFVKNIPENTTIVSKGAFFINAKLTNTGEHEH